MPDKKNGMKSTWKNCLNLFHSLGELLGKLFDKVIYSNRASLVVSGIFAALFCVSISYQELNFTFFAKDGSTYTMPSVPVEVQMNTEDYEVIGMPNTADVTIEGDAVDIQLVRTQNSATVIADMRSMTEGKNTVILKAAGLPSGLNVTVTPPSVEVELARKYTVSFQVTPDIQTGSIRKPSDISALLTVKNVTVRATNAKLAEIRSVKAIIDASRTSTDFTIRAPLVAYDSAGRPLDVTITPDTVEVQVKFASSSSDGASGKDSSNGKIDSNAGSGSGTSGSGTNGSGAGTSGTSGAGTSQNGNHTGTSGTSSPSGSNTASASGD